MFGLGVKNDMNIAFAGFKHQHILMLYSEALSDQEVSIVGCYEEDCLVKDEIEKEYNANFVYGSYEELLSDINVEVVAIGEYFARRGQMVIEALRKGKHVLCDKPICTRLDELDEIQRLSEANGLQVCCMLDLRYLSQSKKAKELLGQRILGDIKIASFTGQHCLDYDNRPHWYFEENKHGGTINDIAIHGIDLIRFLTGKNLTHIHCARHWNAFAYNDPNFKDCAQLMAEMDTMALTADVSYSAPKCATPLPTYWCFSFWGTEGMMQFNLADKRVFLFLEKEKIVECEDCDIKYLKDLRDMICGVKTSMSTIDILESQRQTLRIQAHANAYS